MRWGKCMQNEVCDTTFTPSTEIEPPQPSKSMFLWADQMLALRDEQEALEDDLKRIKKKLEETEQSLFECMVNNQVEKFTRTGYSFAPTIKTRASIPAENKEHAMEWLKQSEYADIVKETVNAQTLTSLVKEWEDAGVREDDAPFYALLNIYNEQKISIRKGR